MAIFFKNRSKNYSLAGRLILIALAVGGVFLILTGFLLIELNKRGTERAFDRRLQVYVRLLVTDLTNHIEENEPAVGNILSEPLFEVPQSGWYWMISRVSEKEDLEPILSRSMWDWQFPQSAAGALKVIEGYQTGPDGQRLRFVEREVDLGRLGKFRIIVSGNDDDIRENIRPFNYAIVSVLFLLGLGLMIGTYLQAYFGLKPLRQLTERLALIRNGKADRLAGDYPTEISPLTGELNALIETNKDIVDRARTHVGNLAHALKTPLSVLQNEAKNEVVASKFVREQTDIMQRQVHAHLERAKVAARAQYTATVLDITPLLQSLLNTMQRIYKNIDLESDLENNIHWRGEADDFLELAGNLIDNAFKWANNMVFVSLKSYDEYFLLVIEDDGKGLSDEELAKIGKRGLRLDETKQGSGLGLSIAGELVKLYRGEIMLDHAKAGGLKVSVKFLIVK